MGIEVAKALVFYAGTVGLSLYLISHSEIISFKVPLNKTDPQQMIRTTLTAVALFLVGFSKP